MTKNICNFLSLPKFNAQNFTKNFYGFLLCSILFMNIQCYCEKKYFTQNLTCADNKKKVFAQKLSKQLNMKIYYIPAFFCNWWNSSCSVKFLWIISDFVNYFTVGWFIILWLPFRLVFYLIWGGTDTRYSINHIQIIILLIRHSLKFIISCKWPKFLVHYNSIHTKYFMSTYYSKIVFI